MVEEPGEEGRQEDVRVVVTSEEEKMVKSVEWSGATGVGMVEAEERGGPGVAPGRRGGRARGAERPPGSDDTWCSGGERAPPASRLLAGQRAPEPAS